MTCRRLAASSANAVLPAAAVSVAAPEARGLGLDGGHDPVVPGQDLRGIGPAETERLGHDADGQRAGHRPA